MTISNRWLAGPLAAGIAAALLTGCGEETAGAGDSGSKVVMGMSDDVLATDPAAGYDPGSWLLFNNVYQSLLSFPKGATSPRPEAAEKCGFADGGGLVYRCTLRDGLTFSNGNPLTSKDVKFSFDRTRRIDDPAGPAVMFAGLDKVTTPDARTVVFHLSSPDATFPQKIASGAGSIVDHRSYPADRLRTDHEAVGSGVYTLDSFDKNRADFSVNPDYRGPAQAQNSGVSLRFFRGDQRALKDAVRGGEIDVAYRGLTMQDIAGLEETTGTGDDELQVVQGTGAEVQHLVFNMKDPVAGKLAVRKAIAQVIDRDALVRDVYKRTAEPLYSIVPAGITGHNTAFYDAYGDQPRRDRAQTALRDAGITDKVELTLWGTPTRYGPGTVPGLRKIAEQLNASGLFDARVRSVELDAYEKGVAAGEYGVYVKGWVPDYPDPDNFVSPFFGKGNVLSNHFTSRTLTEQLIPATAAEPSRQSTVKDFDRIQDLVAEQIPMLPLWQGKQYAVARSGISGLQWTLDASTVFRFWEIEKA
ncbi:ABC transporter substrate-binding protein [Streptomyces sp. NPDC018031]|uniref:ABC transporter substrate-binding protein n=1 Tax=Streptomyces sp. NPDC018031 TaxID=3365033 RepID=UPI0037A07FDF